MRRRAASRGSVAALAAIEPGPRAPLWRSNVELKGVNFQSGFLEYPVTDQLTGGGNPTRDQSMLVKPLVGRSCVTPGRQGQGIHGKAWRWLKLKFPGQQGYSEPTTTNGFVDTHAGVSAGRPH